MSKKAKDYKALGIEVCKAIDYCIKNVGIYKNPKDINGPDANNGRIELNDYLKDDFNLFITTACIHDMLDTYRRFKDSTLPLDRSPETNADINKALIEAGIDTYHTDSQGRKILPGYYVKFMKQTYVKLPIYKLDENANISIDADDITIISYLNEDSSIKINEENTAITLHNFNNDSMADLAFNIMLKISDNNCLYQIIRSILHNRKSMYYNIMNEYYESCKDTVYFKTFVNESYDEAIDRANCWIKNNEDKYQLVLISDIRPTYDTESNKIMTGVALEYKVK